MTRFNGEIIRQIEVRIGIPFMEQSYSDGEVCFANSSEIRSEFKQSFSTFDVLNYIQAVLSDRIEASISSMKIPYPQNVSIFWRLVEQGMKMETHRQEDYIATEWY